MKTTRLLFASFVLVVAFAVPSFAGDVETPGAPVPPPPSAVSVQTGAGLFTDAVVDALGIRLIVNLF